MGRMRIEIDPETGCWIWCGQLNNQGYGRVSIDGKRHLAHRLMYRFLVGPLLAGMELDHLCRRPACVNPEHLEVVDGRENVRRGTSPVAVNMARETCKHGHPFDLTNTYVVVKTGQRQCRKCKARRERERKAKMWSAT